MQTEQLAVLILTGILAFGSGCSDEAGQAKAYRQAIAHYSRGNLDQALPLLEEINKKDPGFDQAILMIAKIYLYKGKHKHAEEKILNYFGKQPESPTVALVLARAQFLQEDKSDQALQTINHVIHLDDSNLRAWVLKGQILESQAQLRKSIQAYKYALNLGKPLSLASIKLATIYMKAGVMNKSRQHLEKARTFSDGDPDLIKLINIIETEQKKRN